MHRHGELLGRSEHKRLFFRIISLFNQCLVYKAFNSCYAVNKLVRLVSQANCAKLAHLFVQSIKVI